LRNQDQWDHGFSGRKVVGYLPVINMDRLPSWMQRVDPKFLRFVCALKKKGVFILCSNFNKFSDILDNVETQIQTWLEFKNLDEKHEEVFWLYLRDFDLQYDKPENADQLDARQISWSTQIVAARNLSKVKIEDGNDLTFGECWIAEAGYTRNGYPEMTYGCRGYVFLFFYKQPILETENRKTAPLSESQCMELMATTSLVSITRRIISVTRKSASTSSML
jgi:hypothetical protein